ncbi:MAG TPA: hypothetical protein VMS56_08455 [Thermoanaerobaculia bacterium]|nr:hypothetical protein [Thermoanaerobaculia bacterium]
MGVYERPGRAAPASGMPAPIRELLDESREWAHGRSWLVRLPLLVYLGWALIRYLFDRDYSSWFAPLSLGIHELGHLLFSFAPFFVTALAGSAAEVVVPIAGMVMFFRQPDYFGISVLGCWLSYNLFGIARYIADSRAQLGVYVTVGGGDAQHDWEYILSSLGLLDLDRAIGGVVKLLALGVGAASLAWGAWMLLQMASGSGGARRRGM